MVVVTVEGKSCWLPRDGDGSVAMTTGGGVNGCRGVNEEIF